MSAISTATSAPVTEHYAGVHLDAIRGLAAVAVVVYHIRYNFFFDYSQVGDSGWLTRLFYTATSFGHDAVIVFFVLSGYLISGSILKDLRANRWSWGRYLVNRLTRLYVVLIPGLLLTVFWDQLGMGLFADHVVYTGTPQVWIHDFFRVADRSGPATFFANLAFLDAINGIPPYGTAGQLWSLTYEFAYYAMFPAALLTVWPSSRWTVRLACAVVTLLLALHFGTNILLAFPIWLLGFGLQLLPKVSGLQARDPLVRHVGVALAVVCGIALTHTPLLREWTGGSQLVADYITGVVFAAGLYVFLHDRRPAGETFYVRGAHALSHVSFSLYVVHLSLLVFLRAAIIDGRPWAVEWRTILFATLIAGIIGAYAGIVWFLFEARTAQVRQLIANRVFPSRRTGERGAIARAHA